MLKGTDSLFFLQRIRKRFDGGCIKIWNLWKNSFSVIKFGRFLVTFFKWGEVNKQTNRQAKRQTDKQLKIE